MYGGQEMDIFEMLKEAGVEISSDKKETFNTEFRKTYKSEAEVSKKLRTVEADRDNWKTRAETAEETLKGFDGKSLEEITKERDNWKKKFEEAEKDYNSKLEAREKEELLKEAFAELEFTSEAAKKAIMTQISENVSVKNGKLIGFNDLLEDAKKNDAAAFVDKESKELEEKKAKFTTKQKTDTGEGLSKDQIMALKDPSERQKAIKEHIELFQKGE